jgi:L-amino acid N-acyltransferase YncA
MPTYLRDGTLGGGNTMHVHVRDATAEDHAVLVRFQLSSALESEGLRLNQEAVDRGVRAVLEDPAKGRYLVAEDGSGVVGCLLIVSEWSDWRNARVLWLHSIYILPEKRRRGVLTGMYRHLEKTVAASPNLCGIRTLVDGRNEPGRAAALKLGMSVGHYDTYEWLKTMLLTDSESHGGTR